MSLKKQIILENIFLNRIFQICMFHIYFFVLKNDILEMVLRLLIKNGIVFRCFRGYINKDFNYHS